MKVIIFAPNMDTGGQGWRIKHAFDRYQPDFSVRSIHTNETYFDYPSDLRYEAGRDNAYKLTEAADVLHFRNGFGGLKRLRHTPVGLVLHHHGSRFRSNPAGVSADGRAHGAIQLASTLDLVLLEPDVTWLPSPYDVFELQTLRLAAQNSQNQTKTVRIAHSPTNRTVKSTNLIMKTVQMLFNQGFPVSLDLIERTPYAKVLERKAKADILVDQLRLGYGNSSIEAMCMGIPVIAGVSDPRTREFMVDTWGALPFYQTDEESLADHLIELITDAGLRSHWGKAGYQHVVKYHNEQIVSEQLAAHYQAAAKAPFAVERASDG